MTSPEANQNAYFQEPEMPDAKVFVVSPLRDLSILKPDINELGQEASCCGSMFQATVGPVGFALGSYDQLRFVCERCACVVCSCGRSMFPSEGAHEYVTQAGREIRDFIDGVTPDDWMYQHIGMGDVAKVKQFKGRIDERMSKRNKQKRDQNPEQ